MTDELKDAHAEIARLRAELAEHEPAQADPVEVLVADYNKLLAGMAGHNAAYTMRAVLNAHGWRQVREVTEAAPNNKTHYCKHYPEGCQEHNLHCAWPACAVLRGEA